MQIYNNFEWFSLNGALNIDGLGPAKTLEKNSGVHEGQKQVPFIGIWIDYFGDHVPT